MRNNENPLTTPTENVPSGNPARGQVRRLKLRTVRAMDYADIKTVMDIVYPVIGGAWTQAEFAALRARFPEGQLCIEDRGRVVAAALSIIVGYGRFGDRHTYDGITAGGYFTTHDGNGETLYGVDVFTHPRYQGQGLGRRLYDARKKLCGKLNLRRIIIGGRIPGYDRYHDGISPREYVNLVLKKREYDPILSFQLANDFRVRRLARNYLPEDEKSRAWAVLLEWANTRTLETECTQ